MAPKSKINLKDRLENGELDLSMSDLQEVPVKDIVQMKKATSLDLSNNRLTTLGKTFVTLTHVIKLDLSKNLLKELPEDFGEMKQLRHLDLYSNQITHLPLSFCELKNLRWLDLKNNPLVPAVAKIVGPCLDAQQCQQSARATVAFLSEMKQQVDEERERLHELQLRQVEQQQDKERQMKKKSERKRAAKAKRKEASKKEVEREEVVIDTITQQSEDVPVLADTREVQKEVKVRRSRLGMWFLLGMSPIIMLFLLSACNALGPTTEVYRTQLLNYWEVVVRRLPVPLQQFAGYLSVHLTCLHTFTGHHIDNLCELAADMGDRLALSHAWNTAYNQSTLVLRTFSERVCSVLTGQIKKIIL